jgi:single-stranded DNA-binding protein
MSNPNNYLGATVTLVGYAASGARNPAYDREGTRGVKQVPIAINEGYKKDGQFVQTGTTWYDVEAGGDAAQTLASIKKGQKIRVEDAKQEVREYTDKNGAVQKGITLKFGTVTVLDDGNDDSGSPF